MMHFTRINRHLFEITLAICAAAGAFVLSCSSAPEKTAEKTMQMPVDYSTRAADTMVKLSSEVPADAEFLAFGSYGSLADSVIQFQKWNIVDSAEVEKLLKDLGTHYLLNPASLRTYFDAGMNTGSGFVGGLRGKNAFVVFDVWDGAKFRAWWDTFMNEEFGRPRYEVDVVGGVTYVKIRILNKDFATLAMHGNDPVVLVSGEGLVKGSADSFEMAKEIIDGEKFSDPKNITRNLSDAPIAVWAKDAGMILSRLPEKFQSYGDWAADMSLELRFESSGPMVRASGAWSQGTFHEQPRGQFISNLGKGSNAGWADAILGSGPTSAVRVLVDGESVESLVLSLLSENQRSKYSDYMDKLTNRMLKLDAQEQIVHNLGAAWVAVYGAMVPQQQNPSLNELLSVQKAAVYVPLKDADKANGFFGKLNLLKGILAKFLPEDKVQFDSEEGMLHVRVRFGGAQLHVGYQNGLIGISTDSAWETVISVLKKTGEQKSDSILARENHFLASSVRVSDITDVLGAKYTIIREQIGTFLAPFDRFELQSSSNESSFEFIAQGVMKN